MVACLNARLRDSYSPREYRQRRRESSLFRPAFVLNLKRGLTAMIPKALSRLIVLSVVLFSLLPFRVIAQDTPVGTPASSATTQEKPATEEKSAAAADDTEGLAKAAQNPVASLISFPLQNNTNFGVAEQPAHSRVVWFRRFESHVLLLSRETT